MFISLFTEVIEFQKNNKKKKHRICGLRVTRGVSCPPRPQADDER